MTGETSDAADEFRARVQASAFRLGDLDLSMRRYLAAIAALSIIALPAFASSGAEVGGGTVLFILGALVLAARVGGLAAERLGAPAVLGELLVGIGLANLVAPLTGGAIASMQGNPTLAVLAELGVLILLFDVGLESDLRSLLRVWRSASLVALIGVVVPLGLGWGAAAWFLPERPAAVHLFVGATLAATSIGITARVLKDLGLMQTREAQIILGAAVLDDILALVLLAVVSGMIGAAASGGEPPGAWEIGSLLLRAVLFLAVTVGLGHLLSGPIVRTAARTGHPDMLLVFGLALCFALAFAAQQLGLADIVGAFAAGLLLDPYGEGVRTRAEEATLSELMQPLSSLFVPLFFVLMGIQVDLSTLATPSALALGSVLVICAFVGKLVSAFGALGPRVNRWSVGIGMVPRGEVGLIFASVGAALTIGGQPVLDSATFSAVVLMVVVTTLAAPIGLRLSVQRRPDQSP